MDFVLGPNQASSSFLQIGGAFDDTDAGPLNFTFDTSQAHAGVYVVMLFGAGSTLPTQFTATSNNPNLTEKFVPIVATNGTGLLELDVLPVVRATRPLPSPPH